MTNPPLFDNQDAFGCWWVVMNYLLGACYGGLSRALILNVTNPTHRCLIIKMHLVVGGLSWNTCWVHVMVDYQGRLFWMLL